MAWTVTDRHFLNSNAGGGTSENTTSVTPTGNSLLLVPWVVANNGGSNNPVISTPTGGSLTYNLIVKDGENDNWTYGATGVFNIGGAIHYAIVGASPSSFAITVDGMGGADIGLHSALCVDLLGYNLMNPIRQSAIAGANVNPLNDAISASCTFASTPAAGNLVFALIVAGGTSSEPALPTVGSGKTMTEVQSAATGVVAGYRVCDGTESATVTCSDCGTQVGSYVIEAVEIRAFVAPGLIINQAVTTASYW